MIKKLILLSMLLFLSACSDGICKKHYLVEYCEEWLEGPLIVDERIVLK